MAGGNKMVWLDRTEIVTGLILAGELNVNLVNADDFFPPYNEIIAALRKGKTQEDIITSHGFSLIQAATMAECGVTADKAKTKKQAIDWVNLLE